MDPDKILNAVADLINGDVDHDQAEAIVDIELAQSSDLEEKDKETIRALIRGVFWFRRDIGFHFKDFRNSEQISCGREIRR
jgi:hypothetical protein